jgi:hypothetical protein
MPHGTESPVATVRRAGARVADGEAAAEAAGDAEAVAVTVAAGRSEDPHAARASAAKGTTLHITAAADGAPGA